MAIYANDDHFTPNLKIMSKIVEAFLAASEIKTFDVDHRKKIMFNIAQYDRKVVEGKEQFSSLELAKTRVSAIKHKSTENLEKYLIEFEINFIKRGGKVIWAQDAEEAVKEALMIIHKAKAKMIVKTKSMVSEEIHLKEALEKNKIEAIETDLGEYIIWDSVDCSGRTAEMLAASYALISNMFFLS